MGTQSFRSRVRLLFFPIALSALTLGATPAAAHHGVAGLGAAGLMGPGAPIETATSATLPARKFLFYLKLDHAKYDTFSDDPESDYANFWLAGLGYGLTSWLSAYLFVPYNEKMDEPGGFDTDGFADISFFGQLGFKWDEGLRLIPENESLDDLEDWHFTLFGGVTAPTGDENIRDRDGNIDPGKSTGFGEPSYSLGLTATKTLTSRLTFDLELSRIGFIENEYADGNRTRFGSEYRVNTAWIYRAFTHTARELRLDLSLEPQYLNLGRDRTNGRKERATGGDILYLLPGLRAYWKKLSVGLGVKVPVWTGLNEENEQQGGEGTEDYRFLFTFSVMLP